MANDEAKAEILNGQGAYECPRRKALLFVKAWFAKLESGTDEDDPLTEMRRKFHAPVHAAIDAGLAARCRSCEPTRKDELDAPGV